MKSKFTPTIKKLQRALNTVFDAHILINTTQFYGQNCERPIEIIIIKKAVWDEEKQRNRSIELFSSSSDIQILLWLRDYWYELNGWEVPTDNEMWEKAKERYLEKQDGKCRKTNDIE